MANDEIGALRIIGLRGGTASEIVGFLTDLDRAYRVLYRLDFRISVILPERLIDEADSFSPYATFGRRAFASEEPIQPEYRLRVSKVRIESPGFWEVVGSLNVLETLRKYLNDRDERRKDKEYRESAERRKLDLENEDLLNRVLEGRIKLLKTLGIPDATIRQMIWTEYGVPFTRLGDHQDSGLVHCEARTAR